MKCNFGRQYEQQYCTDCNGGYNEWRKNKAAIVRLAAQDNTSKQNMYFKKLIGKKCYLSPIDPSDAPKFAEWLNDMEVLVNLQLYGAAINSENEKAFLEDLAKGHNYSIIDLETEDVIGNCGFLEIDHVNQTAETGIFIGNKTYWNKGYGTEALSLLIDYGFKALNLHNVMLRVYEFNKGAIRCYEKIGFKHFGTRREALLRNLERHNVLYMDILPEDFYGQNEQS